jgi:hypothetical protein
VAGHQHCKGFSACMCCAGQVGAEPTAYAKLEGLGKVPFSNIRRPRPLMDLDGPGERLPRDEDEARALFWLCFKTCPWTPFA